MVAALGSAYEDRWTHNEELLALIAELLHTLIRVTVQVHSDPKKHRPDKPWSYPRPSRPVAEDKHLDRHKVRRALLGGR